MRDLIPTHTVSPSAPATRVGCLQLSIKINLKAQRHVCSRARMVTRQTFSLFCVLKPLQRTCRYCSLGYKCRVTFGLVYLISTISYTKVLCCEVAIRLSQLSVSYRQCVSRRCAYRQAMSRRQNRQWTPAPHVLLTNSGRLIRLNIR